MKNFRIICDSREKDLRIQEELRIRNISFLVRKLDFGDYSFEFNGRSYENEIVIERKGSINEIVGNFTRGKKRFEREFKRAKGCKLILMIEGSEKDITDRNYKSRLPPKELMGRLKTWSNYFGILIKYVKKSNSTDYIINTFIQYIKSEVKK